MSPDQTSTCTTIEAGPPQGRGLTHAGKAAEHLVIARLVSKGYIPMIPVVDFGVDVCVYVNGRFIRLQVKSSTFADAGSAAGAKRFGLHRSGTGRQKLCYDPGQDEFDFFALVAMPEEVVFVVPFRTLKGRRGPTPHNITLRPDDYRREAWHLLEEHGSD